MFKLLIVRKLQEKAQRDVFKLRFLSDQQSKTQRYLFYCDIKQPKAANHHIEEAVTSKCLWKIT